MTVSRTAFETVVLKHLEAILLRVTNVEITLNKLGARIMADITQLTAAVAAETTVDQSVLALVQGLASQVANLQPTQAAIDALAAQLQSNVAAMQAAITANTPAVPAPAPAP